MPMSESHRKAQWLVLNLLAKHYWITSLEAFTPAPSEKYLFDGDEFITKPYLLDVFASTPKPQCEPFLKHDIIGVEIDGGTGHKKTKAQYKRDLQRTKAIEDMYPGIFILRLDTKDLVGRGYVNPKTKERMPLHEPEDINKWLGISCEHERK